MVPPAGPQPCPIYLIGEAPDRAAVKAGRPFMGPSGRELWNVCGQFGLDRDQVRVANLCWEVLPDNRDPEPEDIVQWESRLVADIAQTQPEVVVALGRIPTQWVLGRPVTPDLENGLLLQPGEAAQVRVPVIPCLRPADALHEPEIYSRFWRDLQRLGAWVAGDREPLKDSYPDPKYLSQTPSQALEGPIAGPVGVDTEGTLEEPLGACYNLEPGTGFWCQDWSPEFGQAVLHNALYDLPMVAALGGSLGQVEDTMIMAHILGEPKIGLKTLAFRHCGMVMTDYEDVVRPAQKRLAVEYLMAALSAWEPEYLERISAKTGKLLKPKKLPTPREIQAVVRCLKREDPHELWTKQNPEIHDLLASRVGCRMPEATLEDV